MTLFVVLALVFVGVKLWGRRETRLLCDELEKALHRKLTTGERQAIWRS